MTPQRLKDFQYVMTKRIQLGLTHHSHVIKQFVKERIQSERAITTSN